MKNNNHDWENTNDALNDLFDKVHDITLSPLEKENMLRHIQADVPRNIPSPFVYRSYVQPRKLVPVFLVVLLLISGGVSFAAEGSLPGDLLYPVKIHINEKVASAVSIGAKSQAEVAASHASTRLMEIEKLSIQNKLNFSVVAEAEKSFSIEAEKVAMYSNELSSKGETETANEINSDLELTLETHKNVLAAMSQEDQGKIEMKITTNSFSTSASDFTGESTNTTSLSGLVSSIDLHIQTVAKNRREGEQAVATSTESAKIKAATAAETLAKNKINEVKKYINKESSSADSSLVIEVGLRLQIAEDLLVQGQSAFDAKEYGNAFLLFKQSSRKAQEAKLMLNSKNEIKSVLPTFLKIKENEEENQKVSQKISTEKESQTATTTEETEDTDIIKGEGAELKSSTTIEGKTNLKLPI